MNQASPPVDAPSAEASRSLGLVPAVSLNLANMVGIGPFITIPAFIATMQGPQAMIGWVLAAILVICDGLVWSELGAALPGNGGSYHFLKQIFGGYRWGRAIPFLFIWQFMAFGALEIASGYIGAMPYLEFAVPGLAKAFESYPWLRQGMAAGFAIVVCLLLCQRIQALGWLTVALCGGTMLTVLTVIVTGIFHFDSTLLTLPPNALHVDRQFMIGLGGAMLIAVYDYLGYYNVCHLGREIREPAKVIPRAILISVLLIAAIYLTMNVSILGVVPWQVAMHSKNIAADFMEIVYGRPIAVGFTWMILWTSFACVFAMTFGYSRIPVAAAENGDFFPIFRKTHPTRGFPWVSLLALGALTAACCFLSLQTAIEAAVTVRIAFQFIGQIIALWVLRTYQPHVTLPFRMWLYPLPCLIALVGWCYLLATANSAALWLSVEVIASGIVVYGIRSALIRRRAR